MKKSGATTVSEAAIFARILDGYRGALTVSAARFLLSLDFSDADKSRIHDLAVRNQDGALSSAEQEELFAYVKVGDLLALLQSKARQFMKKKKAS